MYIEVYTDGACRGNGRKDNIGAWAWTIHYIDDQKKSHDLKKSGHKFSTTNNEMELTAIHSVLLHLYRNDLENNEIAIFSDSSYCIDCITKWSHNWKNNGWKKSNGDPVMNMELIYNIYNFVYNKFTNIKFIHLRGHSGNVGNEYVDKLCNYEMDNAIKNPSVD